MNDRTVKVSLEGKELQVAIGTTLETLADEIGAASNSVIVAALVDNEMRELGWTVREDCGVSFVDLSSDDGIRVYQRSLNFLLVKALHDCYPDRDVSIRHSVSKGIFFDVIGPELGREEIGRLESHMKQLVERNIPFQKVVVSLSEAKNVFRDLGRLDRIRAVKGREKQYVTFYLCEDVEDYFYGYMVPSTAYLRIFSLEHAENGIVLVIPKIGSQVSLPSGKLPSKLFSVFQEYTNWIRILGVEEAGHINEIVAGGKIEDFIRIAEALHEKKIASIADQICQQAQKLRIVIIAGPSSSGKTTFAQRLSVQLRVNGIVPVNISVDDYFVDQQSSPRDEHGKPDFEALECVDLRLFNHDLKKLISGAEINLPSFNFTKGKREYKGRKLRLGKDQILIVEGIHGLNPRLTEDVDADCKFHIYISAITSMQIDRHNRIPTTDLRLVRRLVRDHRTRGADAPKTLQMWPSVRRGEEKNIFPFQEKADAMFNSSLIYELGVLKTFAMPLLSEINSGQKEYAEARRLIEFLSYFESIDDAEIPRTSILREFIGGSAFHRDQEENQ